jgi:hypothetical protein
MNGYLGTLTIKSNSSYHVLRSFFNQNEDMCPVKGTYSKSAGLYVEQIPAATLHYKCGYCSFRITKYCPMNN